VPEACSGGSAAETEVSGVAAARVS
jgi:hypothetical protein